MKTLDKYRRTNTFKVCGIHIKHLAAIDAKFSSGLVAVANVDEDSFTYVCRLSDPSTGISDVLVSVCGSEVEILEREEIIEFKQVS